MNVSAVQPECNSVRLLTSDPAQLCTVLLRRSPVHGRQPRAIPSTNGRQFVAEVVAEDRLAVHSGS
jgi:hypothetical protein